MPFKTLIYEKKDLVGVITLNRPERLNAISLGLEAELEGLLDEIRGDDNVRVIIITGAPRADGRPCFCAGADLKDMKDRGGISSSSAQIGGSPEEQVLKTLLGIAEGFDVRSTAFYRVWTFPKPIIAAIDGVCTAGGIELALCCDLRVAAETAQISDIHMKNLGSLGGGGLQSTLPPVVGVAKAKEIAWTGDVLDGKEAWRIGLVNRVFPPDKMMDGAMKLAKQIAAMRPVGIRMSKLVFNASLDQGIFESLRFSDFCHALTRYMTPGDQKESFAAFVEKRKPTFKGA